MLSLTIHHNIHLTRQQRYDLNDGKEIETTGVSVPIWVSNKTITEPAKEVFCQYFLKNPKKEVPIQILQMGYEITLPHREGTTLLLSDEDWKTLNRDSPEKLEAMYKMLVSEVSSKNLLDIKDGGCGALAYREHNKIKKGEEILSIMHYVNIESMDHLLNSLTD